MADRDDADVELGSVSLALESEAASGNRYRLRQATFLVDRSTFNLDDFLGGIPFPIDISDLLDILGPDFFGPETFEREATLDSEDNVLAPEISRRLRSGSYRIFLREGWFLQRLDGNRPVEVEAELVGSNTQMFSIAAGDQTVVSFSFETNGEVVEFGRGRLTVRAEIAEVDGSVGDGGPPDPEAGEFGRVIENNLDALSGLSLSSALAAVGANGGTTPDPQLLYQSIIDSYASANQARMPEATHCGDDTTDGAGTLNGFPITCDRIEVEQFDNLDEWFAIAAVNRLDLAPEDGSHCGQQRLVFANNVPNGNSRMFMILEAQIPNPNPECGAAGCEPLAAAWDRLAENSDPAERGSQLAQMFLSGDPQLAEQGIGPFLNANHMTVGSGQIRTNNFNDDPWTLREFKVVTDAEGGVAMAVPFPVAESPHGALWNDLSGLPQGEACREDFLDAMDGLLTDNPASMSFIVAHECKDSESRNDFSQDYLTHLNNGSGQFASAIEARLAGTGLTAQDIARRAQFAGSCIGCHEESGGAPLGNGLSAPFSTGFVHVSEQILQPCADGDFNCSGLSAAMENVFLPHRLDIQDTLLGTGGCGGGGPVIDGGTPTTDGGGPIPTDGGIFEDGGIFGDGGIIPDSGASDGGVGFPIPPDFPFPTGGGTGGGFIVDPTAPQLTDSVTTEDLVEAEQLARSPLEDLTTLGGRPATSTH